MEEENDLSQVLQFESGNFLKRLCAFGIDFVIVIVIWFLISLNTFNSLNNFMANLNPDAEGALEAFKDEVTKVTITLVLKFIFSRSLYYLLVPAIIGSGKTLGKLFAGLSMVDRDTLEEVKPIKLVYRELFCRLIIEDILIIPGIVSIIISLKRKDSRCLHDLIANTVVITKGIEDVRSI